MAVDPHNPHSHAGDSVEMPEPTIFPLVLSLGMVLMAAGLAMSLAFSAVGMVLFLIGLGGWIGQLLPGRGHQHEPLVEPAIRPRLPVARPGTVTQMRPGMVGYRFHLPEKVHPISAGIKGGLVGGALMIVPALMWGLVSGHGFWYPVNLLAGMAMPGVEDMTVEQLQELRPSLLVMGTFIHLVVSVILGLVYGVLLPTLPTLPRPVVWGGLLMPLFWTGLSYSMMGFVNPSLALGADWAWFIASQLVFGLVTAWVYMAMEPRHGPIRAGILGALAGGLLMALPAFAWGLLTGNGIWYPVNLLAGMILRLPNPDSPALREFNATWFLVANVHHLIVSLILGLIYGMLLPKLPHVSTPIPWGGVVMPLLWTGASYSLMGVLNPALQQKVDWPWFVVSQFVFGIAAAIVVDRTEMVYAEPVAGPAVR